MNWLGGVCLRVEKLLESKRLIYNSRLTSGSCYWRNLIDCGVVRLLDVIKASKGQLQNQAIALLMQTLQKVAQRLVKPDGEVWEEGELVDIRLAEDLKRRQRQKRSQK